MSKAYRIIDMFSEDIDMTCDIRKLTVDLTGGEEFLPTCQPSAQGATMSLCADDQALRMTSVE